MGESEMILLSSVINTFVTSFLRQYQDKLLPSHYKALTAMETCRTKLGRQMLVGCTECDKKVLVPHSCGHRNCPHCQAHESQQWLERQLKRLVPAEYFLVTFTVPSEFRPLVWQHQRTMYSLMIKSCWETLKTFSQNDPELQGLPGAIAVLHTHSRCLDFHPHVHVIIPAAAIDKAERLWRTKSASKNGKSYLFNVMALAKVFRAKVLDGIRLEGLPFPAKHPEQWRVNCKSVGSGEKALVYLGRYLYRGVIQEKDIVACENGLVTFRYQNSDSKKQEYVTVTGEEFLWLLLQHVLPKGFRRSRNFGFLHPNSKRMIQLLQRIYNVDLNRVLGWFRERPVMKCSCCGGSMEILKTRIPSADYGSTAWAPT